MKNCKVYAAVLCALTFSSQIMAKTLEPADTEVWQPIPKQISFSANNVPSDAIILFDGSSTSAWQKNNFDEKIDWTVLNGAMTVAGGTGDIKTRENFCDVQLHIEWQTPAIVTDKNGKELNGQERNNSGVFFQERYEVQILDSYKNQTYSNGQAGAIYKQYIPEVNASLPPTQWQTYDIIYNAPKFSNNILITPANMTVLHNGVLIQNNVQLQGPTVYIGKPSYSPHGCAPILLQDHGNPISFRNIWLRKL